MGKLDDRCRRRAEKTDITARICPQPPGDMNGCLTTAKYAACFMTSQFRISDKGAETRQSNLPAMGMSAKCHVETGIS
jgi:hypothetical protein